MGYHNKMKISFLSISENESFARSVAGLFALQLNPSLSEISDVKTAVSEAVTNSIVHGYPNTLGKIVVKVRILEKNTLEISVRDWGCGIENIDKAREPMFTTGGEERSGMGFTIMESFTDRMRVKSKLGHGTTVVMQKRIAPRMR